MPDPVKTLIRDVCRQALISDERLATNYLHVEVTVIDNLTLQVKVTDTRRSAADYARYMTIKISEPV